MAKSTYGKALDRIARGVYAGLLKNQGFTKKNRVFSWEQPSEAGLVQVVELIQGFGFCRRNDRFTLDVGIYVPELNDPWMLDPALMEQPKNLHAYLCPLNRQNVASYSLADCDETAVTGEVITVLTQQVLPALELLRTREQLLKNRERLLPPPGPPVKYQQLLKIDPHVCWEDQLLCIKRESALLLLRMGRRAEAEESMRAAARFCLHKRQPSVMNFGDILYFSRLWNLSLGVELESALMAMPGVADFLTNREKDRQYLQKKRGNRLAKA